MSQTTLQAPDSYTKPPTTRDENTESGWSFKRVLDTLNTMFTEVYGYEAARVSAEGARSPIQFVDVTITSALLLALNAPPQQIVAAPGAGLALIFDSAILYKAAGTAYAGIAAGEDLSVKYTNAAGAEQARVETTGFLDQATAQTRFTKGYAAASGISDVTPTANAALVLHLLSGEITTGDSDLKLRVYYRVVPTTL